VRSVHHSVLLFSLVLPSCGGVEHYTFTRFAMDTAVEYTVAAPSHSKALAATDAAHAEMERVEKLLWEGNPASEIYGLNQAVSAAELSPETRELLDRWMTYSMRTGGAFDVTVKPILDLYGFGGGTHRVPGGAEIRLALAHVGIAGLRPAAGGVTKAEASIQVAVGGVAKGYAIDRAVQVLREHGIESAIVNAGGDLYCLGTNAERPWLVGIRDPDDPDGVIAIVEVSDAAVATSGDYERFFESEGVRYHHIINPRTGLPARHLRSATVVAPTAEEADAFATAVFVLGADRGLDTADRERLHALVVDTAGVISATPSFPGHLE